MKARTIFRFLFGFSGRMARKPFWIAYMADQVLVITLALLLFNVAIPDIRLEYWEEQHHMLTVVGIVFLSIILLAATISGLALVSRRLHDTGRSFGGYIGICFLSSVCSLIPFLGQIISMGLFIWLIIMFCQPSDNEDNIYGPAPQQDCMEETTTEVNEQDSQEEFDCTHLNGILLEPCDDEDDQLLFEETETGWTI